MVRVKFAFMMLAAAFVAVPATTAQAQEMGRFRVLIPNFEPLEDANKKFGEKAAEELRDLINTLAASVDREEGDRAEPEAVQDEDG